MSFSIRSRWSVSLAAIAGSLLGPHLAHAQEYMKQRVDKSRQAEVFVAGDEVVLSTKNLWTYAMHLPMKL